jgi:uncharacterized protein YkwD
MHLCSFAVALALAGQQPVQFIPQPQPVPFQQPQYQPASFPQPALTGSFGPSTGAMAESLLSLHNQQRALTGSRPLSINPILSGAAQAHANEIAGQGRLNHQGLDGSWPWDRARSAGYPGANPGTVNENIGWNMADPPGAVRAWMQSSGHRANLLNPAFSEVGFGYAVGNNGPYWVALFGRGAF